MERSGGGGGPPDRSMLEVLHVLVQLLFGVAAPGLVIRRDIARLSPERWARSWNDATLWAAAAAFGPLALVVHFARTRRSFVGLGLGLLWASAVVAASTLIATAFPS
nr:MAG: hypothetical protein DIU78_15275 [Pseudomonadota bacterium]